MAYETASASSPNDLLDKLRIFALANGWTVDYWGGRTSPGGGLQAGSNQALMLSKSGLCLHFSGTASTGTTNNPGNYLNVYHYPGPWVSTDGTDAQAGKAGTCVANNVTGPYTAYHFFASGQYLHVVLEVVPGRFSHLGAGVLDKAGGGLSVPYAYALSWEWGITNINLASSSFHAYPWDDLGGDSYPNQGGGTFRADSDSISPRNFVLRNSGSNRAVGGWRGTAFGISYNLTHPPSQLTGRAMLSPAIVMIERSPGVFSIAGTPPDLRIVRMDNMAPGEVMTIGSDSWKCFPCIRKNGPAGVENSAFFGYAYRVTS